LLTGAIVNARATAHAAAATGLPVTLLCAGTNDQIAMEDLLGCGAVLVRLAGAVPMNDEARIAMNLWHEASPNVELRLQQSRGGQNVINAGLSADIAFAAMIDRFPHACRVEDRDGVLAVRRVAGYDPIA
ncbi:MAG: 2-phosphosulfolactate phosphatase, partial [Burkholderiales bacterium]|nr:2-phosphosulfolactate phosphatase [Phycisphaerae bacterium]